MLLNKKNWLWCDAITVPLPCRFRDFKTPFASQSRNWDRCESSVSILVLQQNEIEITRFFNSWTQKNLSHNVAGNSFSFFFLLKILFSFNLCIACNCSNMIKKYETYKEAQNKGSTIFSAIYRHPSMLIIYKFELTLFRFTRFKRLDLQ